MTDYPLLLVTYSRGPYRETGRMKPYHWALFMRIHNPDDLFKDAGIVHQLRGTSTAFRYVGPETIRNIAKSGKKVDEILVGKVPSTQLDDVTRICNATPIDNGETTDWNCQNWAISVIESLKDEGFIDDWVTEDYLRGYLKEKEDN